MKGKGGQGARGGPYRDAELPFERQSVWVLDVLFDAPLHRILFDVPPMEPMAGLRERR